MAPEVFIKQDMACGSACSSKGPQRLERDCKRLEPNAMPNQERRREVLRRPNSTNRHGFGWCTRRVTGAGLCDTPSDNNMHMWAIEIMLDLRAMRVRALCAAVETRTWGLHMPNVLLWCVGSSYTAEKCITSCHALRDESRALLNQTSYKPCADGTLHCASTPTSLQDCIHRRTLVFETTRGVLWSQGSTMC